MKRLLSFLPLFSLLLPVAAVAQLGNFGDQPIEIESEHTSREGGVIIADQNVFIRHSGTVIYCDYAQYNPDTHDALLLGNVRIYREGRLYTGERAVENLETKKLTAANFRVDAYPFNLSCDTLSSLGPKAYSVRNGLFTTSASSNPDYHLFARGARIYQGDRIIMTNVTLYVGQTPIFWFPYIYQSLNKNQGFFVVPGYNNIFGAYLRSRYTFPITQDIGGTFELDLLQKRGVGLGFSSRWGGGDTGEEKEWGRFQSYFIHDLETTLNNTSLTRMPIDANRYRVSLQDRTYLTEDIYSSININKLSDAYFLEDFLPALFRSDRNPDNLLMVTKRDDDYTVTLDARKSLNRFFDTTERLPELALDTVEHPIFGDSGLFYTGQTSVGYYKRDFATGSIFEDYRTFRADTFHQIELPQEYFGWLSFVPKLGLRGDYYGGSGHYENVPIPNDVTLSDGTVLVANTLSPELVQGGATLRGVFNAGFESSFKLSRAYEQVQSRAWGLDGLRHVIQPYLDFSYVRTTKNPDSIYQFDRINPSTQLPPLDFPEFNSIDAIENQAVVRLGVNNRFQTRRDNLTLNWLEINTFFNINLQRPPYEQTFLSLPLANANTTSPSPVTGVASQAGTFSNVYNNVNWQPYYWLRLAVLSQVPLLNSGFWEVNSSMNFLINQETSFLVSHEYISGNPLFYDSNYLVLGGYRHITDNWAVSALEAYEFDGSYLATQRYSIHRDLSSWVASLTFNAVNNGAGKQTYGLTLTFTLKDLPQVGIPVSFDPTELVGSGSTKNSN